MLTIILLVAIIALATYIAYRITCYFDSNHASIIGELMDLQDRHALLQKQYEFILVQLEAHAKVFGNISELLKQLGERAFAYPQFQGKFNEQVIETLQKIEKHMSTPLDLSNLIALSDGSIVERKPERDWNDFSGVKVGDKLIVNNDYDYVESVGKYHRCDFATKKYIGIMFDGTGYWDRKRIAYFPDDPNAPKLSQ